VGSARNAKTRRPSEQNKTVEIIASVKRQAAQIKLVSFLVKIFRTANIAVKQFLLAKILGTPEFQSFLI
jgi:hypothetical protein